MYSIKYITIAKFDIFSIITIFAIQNFKQPQKKTQVNSIYIVGIMFVSQLDGV